MSELDVLGEQLRQAIAEANRADEHHVSLREAADRAEALSNDAWRRASEARIALLKACGAGPMGRC